MDSVKHLLRLLEKYRRRSRERERIDLVYSYPDTQRLMHRYYFALKYCKGNVLEVGCGEGYGLNYILRKLSGIVDHVIGGDISVDALRKVKKDSEYSGQLICLDAHFLPFRDNIFNAVIALELIEHLRYPQKFIKEVIRILKNDGALILSTPNGEVKRPIEPYHDRLFKKMELEELLLRHGFYKVDWFALPAEKEANKFISLLKYMIDLFLDLTLKNDLAYNKILNVLYKLTMSRAEKLEDINEEKLDSIFAPRRLEDLKQQKLIAWNFIIVARK